jgi:hypothetical protein
LRREWDRGRELWLQDRHHERGCSGGGSLWLVALLKCGPREYPGRASVDDLLSKRSDVNLDATTGKLRWYYQGIPNDFKDWDMQASPISAAPVALPW